MQYDQDNAAIASAYASMQPILADSGAVSSVNQSCVSKYRGVSWIKANQKWKAQITIDGKQTYLGLFESEVEAAFAYDEHAIQLGKPVNFATQEGQKQAAPKRKLQGSEFIGIRPSKFKGVNWCRFSQKWKAQIQIKGKKSHLGCFDDEESAATRYDLHAGPAGKAVNFPANGQTQAVAPRKGVGTPGSKRKKTADDGDDTDDDDDDGAAGGGGSSGAGSKVLSAAEGGVVASPYKGVSWKQGQQQWRAQIQIDGTMHYLGYFPTQEEAARKYDEYAADLGRPANFPAAFAHAEDEEAEAGGAGKKTRFVASKAVRIATAERAAAEAAASLLATSGVAAVVAAVVAAGEEAAATAAAVTATVAATATGLVEAVAATPEDTGGNVEPPGPVTLV